MPRFGLLNPHDQDPERAQLVQAYMVLRSQQTSVQRRLSSPPPESPASSAASSPETRPMDYDADVDISPMTPIRRRSSQQSPSASPKTRAQRSPFLRRPSVPSIPELPESERRIDSDSDKLDSINLKIKATLTDLLNCESVKSDERMRSWVQIRLMDAQQTLNERRRHSSSASHRRVSSISAQGWNHSAYPHSMRIDQVIHGDHVRKLSI